MSNPKQPNSFVLNDLEQMMNKMYGKPLYCQERFWMLAEKYWLEKSFSRKRINNRI